MTDQLPLGDTPAIARITAGKRTLNEVIRELDRELKTRERVYPAWIKDGRVQADTAAHRLECLRTAVACLMRFQTILEFVREQELVAPTTPQETP